MTDIKNPRLLYAKGALFVLGGIMAAALLVGAGGVGVHSDLPDFRARRFEEMPGALSQAIPRVLDETYHGAGAWFRTLRRRSCNKRGRELRHTPHTMPCLGYC